MYMWNIDEMQTMLVVENLVHAFLETAFYALQSIQDSDYDKIESMIEQCIYEVDSCISELVEDTCQNIAINKNTLNL